MEKENIYNYIITMKIKGIKTQEVEVDINPKDAINAIRAQFLESLELDASAFIVDSVWYIREDIHQSGQWTQDIKIRAASKEEEEIYYSLIRLNKILNVSSYKINNNAI